MNKPGKYIDYSGEVSCYGSKCIVKNATFEILESKRSFKGLFNVWVIFESGVIVSGKLERAIVEGCDFYGENLNRSVFRGGSFNKGIFYRSHWFGGEWVSGEWADSYDKFGRIRSYPPYMWNSMVRDKTSGIIYEPGNYSNFTGRIKIGNSDFDVRNVDVELGDNNVRPNIIYGGAIVRGITNNFDIYNSTIFSGKMVSCTTEGCVLLGGTFEEGIWKGGHWDTGIWEKGTWEDGKWMEGDFNGGDWLNGEWWDGTFDGGTWHDGTWRGGEWNDGTWLGGYDKHEGFHDKHDSPDSWGY